jgi:hypothetical protein
MPQSTANSFSFAKDGKFLDNHLGASISVTAAGQAVAERLLANAPFPTGTTTVGSLSASVQGSTGDLKFGDGKGTVSFSGSATATSLLAVYDDTATLLKGLEPDPAHPLLEGLTLDGSGSSQFFVLGWGYNVHASVSGSMALGPGASLTFSGSGASDGLFAVVRGFENRPRSQDGIQDTIDSWMLPRQVESVDDLAPGTWLIAEVDGSLALKVGAQYGYNYSWIRKVDLGELSGDVGFKIQAAVSAAVGFNTSGKYLMLVGRESADPASKTMRVRLSKMSRRGWDFAFNASVGVTGSTGKLLPDQLDDFVSAVFGVHGAQIVEDLKTFDKWADPATPLPEMFAGFVTEYVNKGISGVLDQPQARQKISEFLTEWNDLGHTTSSMLLSALQKAGGPIPELIDFLKQTKGLDDGALKTLIEDKLSSSGLGSSPIGKFLEAATEHDVLSLVMDTALMARVRAKAKIALGVLDGSVLTNLIDFVNEKLHINDIESVVSQGDFSKLDAWLKAKLAKFLGKQQALFADLEHIRAAAKTVRDKASDLYKQAVKALNSTYTASFQYTYAKTTTSTALVDLTFDFVKNPALGAYLKQALSGDLRDLLVSVIPGVTIRAGALTHGVQRHTHIDISLPHFRGTLDHLNESLATMKIEEDGGRIFAYELKASDEVVRARKWSSALTLSGAFKVPAGVATYEATQDSTNGLKFGYTLRRAQRDTRDLELETQIRPLVGPYFLRAFGGPQAPDRPSLHEWVGGLEASADQPSKGALGEVLTLLDVRVASEVCGAWLKAPKDPEDGAYTQLSVSLQAALRRFTQLCYFDTPKKYKDLDAAWPILVYCCLPLRSAGKAHYWNWPDPGEQISIVNHPTTATTLASRFREIRDVLRDSKETKGSAQFYDPNDLHGPLHSALGAGKRVFEGLLFTEAQTIQHAVSAALQLAAFQETGGDDPEDADVALEKFGAKLTNAFNGGLGSLIPRLAEFSSMIFTEGARALDPNLAPTQPIARLDTILLKTSAPKTVGADFVSGKMPDASVIAFEVPIVGWP